MEYYDAGTESSGSVGPLRDTGASRNVLRTGWGPRGDSGSARSRVRATQPALFSSLYVGAYPFPASPDLLKGLPRSSSYLAS